MHRRDVSTRRRFLGLAGSTAAIGALPMLISVRPVEATPEMMATAIRTVTGGAAVQTGKVKLDIPPLVEQRADDSQCHESDDTKRLRQKHSCF